jgi:hypothetical protein
VSHFRAFSFKLSDVSLPQMLQKDLERRLSYEGMLNHPFFASMYVFILIFCSCTDMISAIGSELLNGPTVQFTFLRSKDNMTTHPHLRSPSRSVNLNVNHWVIRCPTLTLFHQS